MKIHNFNIANSNPNTKAIEDKKAVLIKDKTSVAQNPNLCSYPKNYYGINFGTRSIKDIYDNQDSQMPQTVRNFIDDLQLMLPEQEFESLINQPRLYQLQKEAFSKLPACNSVEEIKKAYPAEACFKDMVEVAQLPQGQHGVFNVVSSKINAGEKIFDFDEELTAHLAKQLFYECKSMSDVQLELAKATLDEDVRKRIIGSSTWNASTFLPLGIKVPDGNKYGKAVLYSTDNKYSTRLSESLSASWSKLSPEEVNMRIEALLSGVKKERITMIDAWNKCIPVRQKLSDFLYENIDNPKYNKNKIDENDLIGSIYNGAFYSKMKLLMTDFWALNPECKEELSLQIKDSRRIYEQKEAQGAEALEQYETEVINTQTKIKEELEIERKRARAFSCGKSHIDNAEKIQTQKANLEYLNSIDLTRYSALAWDI